MSEWDNGEKFWKRTTIVLGSLLALSIATICAMIAVMVVRSTAHRIELNAVRTPSERDRDIVLKMWQVTNDTLDRERQQAAGDHSRKK